MSALSSAQLPGAQALQGSPIENPSVAPASVSGAAKSAAAGKSQSRHRVRTTPLLGRLSLKWQSIILLGMLVATVAVAVSLSVLERREARVAYVQNGVVGDVLMHSQRMAKAANLAVRGQAQSYEQLESSRNYLSAASVALLSGGTVGGSNVPAVAAESIKYAEEFNRSWQKVLPSVQALIDQRAELMRFQELVAQVVSLHRELSATQQAALTRLRDTNAVAQDQLLMTRLRSQTRTIEGEIIRMHGSSSAYTSRDAVTLANAIQEYVQDRSAAISGDAARNIAAIRNNEAREMLRKSQPDAERFARMALEAQKLLPVLERSRAARNDIISISDEISGISEGLRSSLNKGSSAPSNLQWGILGFASAAVLSLLLLCKAYYDDSKIQADRSIDKRLEAERMEQEASRINDQNQAAILRLMNELQNVADGDLTVQATVSNDITGAIADSINYTVEELRSLVGRINRTAAAVAEASAGAQVTAQHLQAVSEQQSREIRETGEAVLNMAAQIRQVSDSAAESAEVARQSLSAASRGRDAVQNAIAGMGGIREQIQDTAKRIKRLGESSQEIGEIVELISNITEQTNVLALNAAIQAASAGEAGRGFTVVAEEVQRLAERSAEATQQISTLVKAIQADTHDAVMAMERSTAGVVRGAKLSDEAGSALINIGQVSQELADLIMRISKTTENQAASASSVAQSIQRILLVNSQTNEGTQQTAGSILQLSELARELKNSVARFRVS